MPCRRWRWRPAPGRPGSGPLVLEARLEKSSSGAPRWPPVGRVRAAMRFSSVSFSSRSFCSAARCSEMSVWTPTHSITPPHPRPVWEWPGWSRGGHAPSAQADTVLEHEGAAFGDRGVPGVDGRLRVLRVHRRGPAEALVLVAALARELPPSPVARPPFRRRRCWSRARPGPRRRPRGTGPRWRPGPRWPNAPRWRRRPARR